MNTGIDEIQLHLRNWANLLRPGQLHIKLRLQGRVRSRLGSGILILNGLPAQCVLQQLWLLWHD